MRSGFRDPRTARYGEGRTRCITVDDMIFKVTSSFDESPDGEDMKTLRKLAETLKAQIKEEHER